MDIATGTRVRDSGPVIGDAGMFLIEVGGPTSDEEFGVGFAEQIGPALAERRITTVLARDDDLRYAIYGFHSSDPTATIGDALGSAGWHVLSARFFKGISALGLPRPPTVNCQMPHNLHQLQPGQQYKTCVGADQHQIAAWHNVDNCPVCGQALE